MSEPVFNYTLHKEMWNWVAKQSRKSKCPSWNREWLDANGFGEMKNDCFACQYAQEKCLSVESEDTCICVYCPLEWGEYKQCREKDSLYEVRSNAITYSPLWRECSLIVADLQVKEGVVYA